ncbi:MAG: phage holin family protein [Christensenellales bacterium]|jgi:hypothetical protein
MQEQLMQYVDPALTILVPVLFLAGLGIKKANIIAPKWIPLILGLAGVTLCLLHVLATSAFSGPQDVLMAIFAAICQGILVAGASVYCHQMGKQMRKET